MSLRSAVGEVLQDLGVTDRNVVEVEDLIVHADRGQLRALLQNLLSNAMT